MASTEANKIWLETLEEALIQFIADCKAAHVANGVEVTGATSKLYRYHVGTVRALATVSIPKIVPYLEHGRGAGGVPPLHVFEKWLEDKGIRPADDAEARRFARNIQRITASKGSYKYRRGIEQPILDEPLAKLAETLSNLAVNGIRGALRVKLRR